MTEFGMEPSITTRFANQFKRECEKKELTDITVELSGQDNKANADAIFGALKNFLLIEFKSQKKGIKTEKEKGRVYDLCHRLLENKAMNNSHRSCHFIMWGERQNGRIETRYTVYQDSVCRKSVLVESNLLDEPEEPMVFGGENLATEICNAEVGLGLEEFLEYLKWLFSSKRSSEEKYDGPVSLVATSSSGYIDGLVFDSFEEFEIWAEPTVIKLLSQLDRKKRKTFGS
ncbi:hypothetical protein EH164_13515 [Kosakonia sp. CCTCC M2018092]|uniref:hypothetical protein n=1 Tax=Kosakonia sp. CCTCC M2018092 TaxID=2492396 RepID=UPI000F604639|nr:hypothetical protein [Kosakonia sp. CCTCC M2018092]AZI88018.1 hypothetical protein EH164_13515 [Kosakonia sp. CCTCC M2018092]